MKGSRTVPLTGRGYRLWPRQASGLMDHVGQVLGGNIGEP
jgi:hypothetical protein